LYYPEVQPIVSALGIRKVIAKEELMISRRLRLTLALIPVVLLLFGFMLPVSAAPPVTEKVVIDPFTIPPDGPGSPGCSFAVKVDPLSNKEKMTTFSNQASIISGGLKVRFTNVITGKSIDRNVSGPTMLKPQPDGSLIVITGGPSFYWFSTPGAAPGQPLLALFYGKTVAEFDSGGNFHFLDAKGKVEDICAALAS